MSAGPVLHRTTTSHDAADARHGAAATGRPAAAHRPQPAHHLAHKPASSPPSAEPTCGFARAASVPHDPRAAWLALSDARRDVHDATNHGLSVRADRRAATAPEPCPFSVRSRSNVAESRASETAGDLDVYAIADDAIGHASNLQTGRHSGFTGGLCHDLDAVECPAQHVHGRSGVYCASPQSYDGDRLT